MKTAVVNVTPPMAREYLKHNVDNRPLRRTHVERLRASYERGEHRLTHQGIAFDEEGHLIDGQHRLTAISTMPDDMIFPMLVTADMKRAEVWPALDSALVTRTTSDVMNIPQRIAEVGNFLAALSYNRTGLTTQQIMPFVSLSKPTAESLIDFCPTVSKTWASSPVKAAAVLTLLGGGDDSYVKLSYRALVCSDFSSMTKPAMSVYRAYTVGRSYTGRFDLFVRCMKVFDPDFAEQSKVQITDLAGDLARYRDLLFMLMQIAATPDMVIDQINTKRRK